jgi:hypothetical protein
MMLARSKTMKALLPPWLISCCIACGSLYADDAAAQGNTSDGPNMFYPFDYGPGYGSRDVERLRRERTQHYTPRQWQLSNMVEHNCTNWVPDCYPSPQNLQVVMQHTGAQPDEAWFVQERMSAVWNARQSIRQSGQVLDDICKDFPAACVGVPR